MTNGPSGAYASLIGRKGHRLATCWRITRTDGTILRFTDAITSIDSVGETFDPTSGLNTSAQQAASGLNDANFTALGALSDSRITSDDLRSRKYDGAQVDVFLVDWRYPHIQFDTMTFWIQTVKWTGGIWQAEMIGLSGKMQRNQGDVYGRTCRHQLGDSGCKINLTLYRTNGLTVATVGTARMDFTSDASEADGYYDFGFLEWKTGNNAGLQCEIATYLNLNGEVFLRVPAFYDIQVGDTFDIYAGCDKLRSTCNSKFANLVNYGGFPFIPGADRMIENPASSN